MHTGLTDVVFVNNQNKTIVEDHFDYNLALESVLERTGRTDLLAEVRAVAEMANIITVRQKVQKGLGHAVLTAREVVGAEPFAVMVGDDLMFGMATPGIGQLTEVAKKREAARGGRHGGARREGQPLRHHRRATSTPRVLFRVRDLVEKPKAGPRPRRAWPSSGRYVLTPEIFTHLEKELEKGVGGEIQLTDALQRMALAKGKGLLAVKLHRPALRLRATGPST